ncbi:MAG: hypothetical protein QOF89_2479 [Acidobacteriota bacterium]|jgi:hypothetical protein|nr:hypothetical protein [Acidobacteriota bacterium]
MSPLPRTRQEGESLTIEEQVRSLVEEGRISEARRLLDTAGELVPAESKIREILSPPRVKQSDKRDVDRSAEFRWIKAHEASHRGKWVALVEEKLVASSDSLKELLVQIDQLQFDRRPLIHHLL